MTITPHNSRVPKSHNRIPSDALKGTAVTTYARRICNPLSLSLPVCCMPPAAAVAAASIVPPPTASPRRQPPLPRHSPGGAVPDIYTKPKHGTALSITLAPPT
ncbi:hypothetical protein E2C01_084142 [Portunus trituberculatus]|uniref:Uncharacterized protein n=1 Tax=Portunus trituberculatus TaxID=210409 RepID=A0A5B7J6N6_PORTR|nr:hypothetical protein [Portunus trituberculatus]